MSTTVTAASAAVTAFDHDRGSGERVGRRGEREEQREERRVGGERERETQVDSAPTPRRREHEHEARRATNRFQVTTTAAEHERERDELRAGRDAVQPAQVADGGAVDRADVH